MHAFGAPASTNPESHIAPRARELRWLACDGAAAVLAPALADGPVPIERTTVTRELTTLGNASNGPAARRSQFEMAKQQSEDHEVNPATRPAAEQAGQVPAQHHPRAET